MFVCNKTEYRFFIKVSDFRNEGINHKECQKYVMYMYVPQHNLHPENTL